MAVRCLDERTGAGAGAGALEIASHPEVPLLSRKVQQDAEICPAEFVR